MKWYDKPHFIIKRNLQKSSVTGVFFSDLLSVETLQAVCLRVTGRSEFSVEFVSNEYSDEFLEATYNKGRLAILLFEDSVSYVSFSEIRFEGRNSSIQSVPTAFNQFFNAAHPRKNLYYYFLPFTGNADTNYHLFIYRLMKTVGFIFINDVDVFQSQITAFASIDDIINMRDLLAKRNSGNNSTYITKDSDRNYKVYGKTYGANKYETSLICYALSILSVAPNRISLFEIVDNGLSELPPSCRRVIAAMGIIDIVPTNIEMEVKSFIQENSLRSPRFIYNLLDKFGTKKCAMCTCEIPELIQGAHIWPVADIKSLSSESLAARLTYATDGDNGIWLCENHHKLFDESFLNIREDGQVSFASNLDEKTVCFINEITTTRQLSSEIMTPQLKVYLSKRYSIVSSL